MVTRESWIYLWSLCQVFSAPLLAPTATGEAQTQVREGKLSWESSGAHWVLSGGIWSPGEGPVPILQLEGVQGREQSCVWYFHESSLPPGRMILQPHTWGPGQPLPECSDSALVAQGLFLGARTAFT